MPLKHQQKLHRRQVYKTGSTFSIGPTTARYLILILLAIFSLMFLIESAQGSESVIQLRNLQSQKEDLNKELTTLQVNASRLQSLQSLSTSSASQGLVPLDSSVETLTVQPSTNK